MAKSLFSNESTLVKYCFGGCFFCLLRGCSEWNGQAKQTDYNKQAGVSLVTAKDASACVV